MSRPVVMVGVDFSEAAEEALETGALISRALSGELHIVHAWNPTGFQGGALPGDGGMDDTLKLARRQAEAQLGLVAGALSESGLEVKSHFVDGAASRVLPDLAERLAAKLLILGRHGHASLAHVFLGSVSERTARLSRSPVLIVPRLDDGPRLPAKLLVGIDFSSGARDALRVAAGLVRQLGEGGRLLLVHARSDERSRVDRRQAQADDEDGFQEARLTRWAAEVLGADANFEAQTVAGYPEQLLPLTAEDAGCDWIVLGVQGRSALAPFLLGGTTQRVLKLANRPVLVVPPIEAPDIEGVD